MAYNEKLADRTRELDFTGRVMKGFVFVDIDALDTNEKLEYRIALALEFNKIGETVQEKEAVIFSIHDLRFANSYQ